MALEGCGCLVLVGNQHSLLVCGVSINWRPSRSQRCVVRRPHETFRFRRHTWRWEGVRLYCCVRTTIQFACGGQLIDWRPVRSQRRVWCAGLMKLFVWAIIHGFGKNKEKRRVRRYHWGSDRFRRRGAGGKGANLQPDLPFF